MKLRVDAQPAKLGRGAAGKDAKQRLITRFRWKGFRIEHGEVPEDPAIQIGQRDSHVADSSEFWEVLIVREEFDYLVWIVDELSLVDHPFARRTGE